MGRDIQFGRDELIHYYFAQAVFNLGTDTWNRVDFNPGAGPPTERQCSIICNAHRTTMAVGLPALA